MVLDLMVGKGKEGVMHEESISKSGILDAQLKAPAVVEVMALGTEGVNSRFPNPMPVDFVTQKQSVMVDSFMGKGTEMGSIKCKNVVGETCIPSNLSGDEMRLGLQSGAKMVSPINGSSNTKTKLGKSFAMLKPNLIGGPLLDSRMNGPASKLNMSVQPNKGLDPCFGYVPQLNRVMGVLKGARKSKYNRIGNSRVFKKKVEIVCEKRKVDSVEKICKISCIKARKTVDSRVVVDDGTRIESVTKGVSSIEVWSMRNVVVDEVAAEKRLDVVEWARYFLEEINSATLVQDSEQISPIF
ncbi:hypothetical protein LWI28_023831 [Acer negundo]|uniref:Uncharacterized protein n=1 Tax=Acer negundo TaxID=4023 RepID=A0AAD5J1U1_ACENE|nr:hypothetical protein LWI28_023831 [Acer negundo]